MLTHQSQHQSVSQSSMSYNIHMNSIHKNLTSSSTSGGYSLQNMKEEPNTGSNNYSNVNGTAQDDMAVSEQFLILNLWVFFLIFSNFGSKLQLKLIRKRSNFSLKNSKILDYSHIRDHTKNRIIIRCHKMHKIRDNIWKIAQNSMQAC